MGRMSLSPGFRFSPTDVELILYYLKRKIMGRKFHYEAIGEVNIYKYSPWELPDKSLLKNKDLEWFFFCPREKKYASGVRIKRATESGFWKTTGKDRTISCNGKTVGTVKTLIFHLGHAPKGERTNWVIHEYRILDDQLAEVQNNYVLCKVFEKNGLGPKNGAQYGAPFCEADWEDDSVAENSSIPSAAAADGPWPTVLTQNEEQCFPVVTGAFGSGNGALTTPEGPSCSAVAPISMGSGDVPEPLSTPEEVPSSSAVAPISVVTEDETTDDEMANILGLFVNEDMLLSSGDGLKQNEEQCLPLGTGLFGSIYGLLPMPEEGLSSPVAPTSMVAADETTNDEMARLLGLFSDEDMLHSNENCLNQDDVSGNRKRRFSSISEGLDLHDFDHDLDIYTGMNGDRLDFFGMQYVDYSLNSNLPYDTSNCIELDDLLPPLDCSDGATETHLSSLCQMDCSNGITGTHLSSHSQASTSYSHENLQQLYSETRFAGINQYNTFYANNLAVQPYTSEGGVYLDEFQTVDHQFYQGSNVSYDSDLPFRQLENAVYTPHHMMERGSHLACIPSAAVSSGGSSIHIKAEVTHGGGECTDEALSVMMGGSSSCWCFCCCSLLIQPKPVISYFQPAVTNYVSLTYIYVRERKGLLASAVHTLISGIMFLSIIFCTLGVKYNLLGIIHRPRLYLAFYFLCAA